MTPLEETIRALIRAAGPISVADYMAIALADPRHGYYATRDPLGAAGDFTTAPEISQMFGELIGVWCLAAHAAMGRPDRLVLAELGPGRGTLMRDLLRAARIDRGFLAAVELHLVETSPTLRARQRETLGAVAAPVWHDRVEDLPDGPLVVVANEFFDALPIRQLVRTTDGWRERVVGLDADDRLAFGIGTRGADPGVDGPVGALLEICPAGESIVATLAARIARNGGALLAIDYGHGSTQVGETLQAVRRHAYCDVLADPGEADLTAHVDFAALSRAARAAGARVHGPTTQGDFLLALGLLERAGRLGAPLDDQGRAAIVSAVERLAGPQAMGALFKAIAVSSDLSLPGFD